MRILLLLLLAGCATEREVSCYGWPDEIGRTLRADWHTGKCYLPAKTLHSGITSK